MESFVCMFEKYQTFFAGLLGFTGVIITMIVNAKHQIAMQDRKLRHDAQTLRVALRAELDANKKAFETRIEQLDEPSGYNQALMPNHPIDQIYSSRLSELGLLSNEETENVVNAYLLISDLFLRIRILVGTDNVIGINNEIIRVSKELQSIVSKMHKSFLPDIERAISLIDQNIKQSVS